MVYVINDVNYWCCTRNLFFFALWIFFTIILYYKSKKYTFVHFIDIWDILVVYFKYFKFKMFFNRRYSYRSMKLFWIIRKWFYNDKLMKQGVWLCYVLDINLLFYILILSTDKYSPRMRAHCTVNYNLYCILYFSTYL